MSENPNKQSWWYSGIQLTEDQILEAMANTTSNRKAAEYLKVSYNTYKKYAKIYRDAETGITLFQKHLNQAMKGIVGRTWVGGKRRINWENILRPNQKASPDRLEKLKNNLIIHEKLELKCYRCGFNEKRVEDEKVPVLMNFKNGDKTNWTLQNIEMVCYNCAFLHCLDFFDDSVIYRVQNLPVSSHINKKDRKEFYKLDDFYLDHLGKLGLNENDINLEKSNTNNEDDVGSEFIDYV